VDSATAESAATAAATPASPAFAAACAQLEARAVAFARVKFV
jgi:hypothetical protein